MASPELPVPSDALESGSMLHAAPINANAHVAAITRSVKRFCFMSPPCIRRDLKVDRSCVWFAAKGPRGLLSRELIADDDSGGHHGVNATEVLVRAGVFERELE